MSWLDFITNARHGEARELGRLLEKARASHSRIPATTLTAAEMAAVDVQSLFTHRGFHQYYDALLYEPLLGFITALYESSGLYGFPLIPDNPDIAEASRLRQALRKKITIWSNYKENEKAASDEIFALLLEVAEHIPDSAFCVTQTQTQTFSMPYLAGVEDVPQFLTDLSVFFCDNRFREAGLFYTLYEQIDHNSLAVAAQYKIKSPDVLFPKDMATKLSTDELLRSFLHSTPFMQLGALAVPFAIEQAVRFEHSHVIGGSGHGKTQCLQHMILSDIEQATQTGQGLCVIDSQGDMIDTISHLATFAPGEPLADRLLIIDPNDIEYPPALNMFDVNGERLASFGAVEREKITNGSIELYEYIFGALLGADLTAKQGTIFKFLARLMLAIPGATIHTLRRAAQGEENLKPYLATLDPVTREFFATQFFAPTYKETRTQVTNRLWAVLSNAIFERMFSAPQNKIDLFDAMNSGKIVLINTAKDLLKKDGCAIFGRFFIAMIAQASLSRVAIPKSHRNPFFVYIDEAQDYFDENIENLLNQARKYNVGLTFAHQNLDQLSTGLRASMLASTSIKMAGGVSAKDAGILAKDMRTTPDKIMAMKKHKYTTEFAAYIRNHTPTPVTLSVPLGAMEQKERMDKVGYSAMIEHNRQRVSLLPDEMITTEHVPEHPPGDIVDYRSPKVDAKAATKTPDGQEKEDDVYAFEIGGAE